MEFNSYLYVFIFLPVTWLAYRVFRKTILANYILCGASIIFYCWTTWWYFIPMLISALLDYFVGAKLMGTDDEARRKRLLILSIVVNIGMLSFFKYSNWISGELATLLASLGIFTTGLQSVNVALPPGISFYTFQTMSYTIDIYKGEFKPEKKRLVDYMSYVSFFPQLVAGPIERAKDLLPQIASERPAVSWSVASQALFMVLFGLFLKVVVADNMGGMIDMVFNNIKDEKAVLPAGAGILFAYAFAFQIYCDFAAYTHIARGTAKLFGVELSRNFLTPYFSTSPSEFWQRWHISLSAWLRDYLYIPLGGNKGGKLKTMRNLVLTMLLGGLWHGAGIFFIVWGLWHGFLLVLYRLLPIDKILIKRFGRPGKILAMIVLFHLICVGWIFFRITPADFVPMFDSILRLPEALLFEVGSILNTKDDNLIYVMVYGIALFAAPVLLMDYFGYRRNVEFTDIWERLHVIPKVAIAIVLFYAIEFFARREAYDFIYFQF